MPSEKSFPQQVLDYLAAGLGLSVSGAELSSINPMPVEIVGGGNDLSVLIIEDSLGVKYIRREVIDEVGTVTITYENFDGTTATPTAPITVASVVLPVGASTSALQTTANTNFGAVADAAATTDTGSFSLLSFIKRGMQNWTSLLSKFSATSNSDADRLPVSQLDGLAISGSVTSAATLFTTSLIGYQSLILQITNAGTGCTITYEQSEDGLTWSLATGISVSSTGSSVNASTTTVAGTLQFARKATLFRARVSVYSSGTVSILGMLTQVPVMTLGAVTITGTVLTTAAGYNSEGVTATGAPVMQACESRTSSKTSIPNAAAVRPIATVDGRQISRANSIPENEWQTAAASGGITNTADNVLQAASGAGIKNYLIGLSLANPSATASEVVVKDGASTVIWRGYLPALAPLTHFTFHTPLQSSANTALNVACITTGTQTYVNAQGYKAP